MSIIRDLLEYYRLPSVVKLHQLDFEVGHSILNGYEERFYYDKDLDDFGAPAPGQPYRMVIDQFTEDDIRFRRTFFVYNEDFVLQYISSQYEYGKKQKDESYVYDASGGIQTITTAEIDIDVIWSDQPPSTGWPTGSFTGRGGLNWIYVNTDINPAEAGTGYIMDTSGGWKNIFLPADPEEGDTIGVVDAEGTFSGTLACAIGQNGKTIMGLSEALILNEKHQGIQLVYDGISDWRITWTTPLIANIVIP